MLGCLALLPSLLSSQTATAADQAVVVPLDVDVFGVPEDDGTIRPEPLSAGSHVLLLLERADHWCHVASGRDPVPGGSGWIWCGLGGDGQDYSVQPVGAEPAPGGGGEPAEEPGAG